MAFRNVYKQMQVSYERLLMFILCAISHDIGWKLEWNENIAVASLLAAVDGCLSDEASSLHFRV